MRKFQRGVIAILILWGVIALVGCQGNGTTQAANNDHSPSFWEKLTHKSQKFIVPEGTDLNVRLADSLTSSGSRSGDTFEATLEDPVEVNNKVVIPQGATVTGQVVEAVPSGHLKTPASLSVTLTAVDVNGKTYDITTSTVGRRAQSHKKHNAKWIGGGAAGGALLGALLGGGKGAAIGAGIGAGGGTAGAYTTGKKDVALYSESLLHFRLGAPVTITQ
jgi:hypothetical protein